MLKQMGKKMKKKFVKTHGPNSKRVFNPIRTSHECNWSETVNNQP